MLRHERSAPIWLFSFVDLAFLLLIAFTQIGPQPESADLDLALLEIPRIQGPGTPTDAPLDGAPWQLRVHPVSTPVDAKLRHAPFRLIEPNGDPDATPLQGADALGEALSLLERRGESKPLLAPHRDARAEDLLVAVSLLDDHWAGTRSAAIRPGGVAAPTSPTGAPTPPVSAPLSGAHDATDAR